MAGATMLGSLLVSLGLQSAEFDRKLGKSRKELTAFEKTTQSLGKTMSGLKTGFAILAASAVTGGLIAATKNGLEYASSLGEVSKQLGVTTKALQEFRYAATQTGVAEGEMDAALARLSRTIGDAASGSKEAAALFQRMGISIRDAQGNVRDTGDILPEVASAYQKLGSEAERAALAYDVFGKSGQKLGPLLAEGSAGLNRLRQDAHELGLVLSDEVINSADETADKITTLNRVLSMNISNAVATNAESIGALVDQLIRLATAAGDAVRAWRAWRDAAGGPNATEENLRIQAENRGGDPYTGGLFNIRRAGNKRPLPKGGRGGGRRFDTARAEPSKTNPVGKAVSQALSPVTGGGGGRSRSTGRTAPSGPSAAEIERRFQDELARYGDQALSARRGLAMTAEETAELEMRGVEAARIRTLEEIKIDKDYSKAQKERLADAVENVAEFERAALLRDERLRLFAESNDLADTEFRAQADALRLQLDLAETDADRKRIALLILKAEDEYLRGKLAAVAANNDLSEAVRKQAEVELKSLNATAGARRESVSRSNETQVERYLRDINKTPEQINEAIDEIKIRGLENLNDQLADAMLNFKSLGDVARNVIKSIIADLLRLQIQKAIIGPLSNFLGLGASLGGGGGLPGTAGGMDLRGFGGARAKGGGVSAGKMYLTSEDGPEIFQAGRSGRIISNRDLQELNGSGAGLARVEIVDTTGLFVTRVNGQIVRAAPSIAEAGSISAQRTMQQRNGWMLA